MAELISLDQPDLAVTPDFFYQVQGGVSIRVLFVSCNMDGSTSGDDWSPVMEIWSPSVASVASFGADVLALAGEFLFMTWAPYLAPAPFGRESGSYNQQSGMPDLVLTHNWQIRVSTRKKNTSGAGNAAVTLTGLAIGVEQLEGSAHNLAYGPFMFVPGPGA